MDMCTLVIEAKAARLRRARSLGPDSEAGAAEAARLILSSVVRRMRSGLGKQHPQTLKYAEILEVWEDEDEM